MRKKLETRFVNSLAAELEADLLNQYGPLLTGDVLRKVLGYRSMAAMNMAIQRGSLTLPLFRIRNRRGKFALAKEVAYWLAEQRSNNNMDMVLPDIDAKEGEQS